eukprot:NODE_17709_length_929_cov_4.506234.p2 GENE.NODE_17709_length_929_cov_4.506234~~NODE_17709_length_929_cov_4.506234.p2  ORF type:complete len:192 (+),score=45.58 NODE_17709_length_929_cov_4.506234:125-700(+)
MQGVDDGAVYVAAANTPAPPRSCWNETVCWVLWVLPPTWLLNLARRSLPNPFLKILKGKLESPYFFQDEQCICIPDIAPCGAFHALVIPRKVIATLWNLTKNDAPLILHMAKIGRDVAREHGILAPRLCINTPPFNSVFQLHMHVMSTPLDGPGVRGIYGSLKKHALNSSWAVPPEALAARLEGSGNHARF